MQRFVLFLAGCLAAFAAHAEQVIPPGREAFFLQLVAQPLPGCTSKDISLQKDHAVFHFACPQAVTVELHPRSSRVDASAATDRFKIVVSNTALPANALDALAMRLKAAEANWEWLEVTEGEQHRPQHPQGNDDGSEATRTEESSPTPLSALDRGLRALFGIRGRPGFPIGLLVPATLLLVGLIRLRRSPPATRREARSFRAGDLLIALGSLVGAIALGALLLSTFRPMNDDFTYLLNAKYSPWRFETSLRFLSVTVPYYLAVELAPSGYPFFSAPVLMTLLALVYAALMTVSGMLASRLGASRGARFLAAGVVGMLPVGLEQLRSAVFLQPLMTWTLVGATLLIADSAARETDVRRQQALTWVALGLTATSVFVKSPLAPVIPIAVWIWGRLVVRKPQGVWSQHRFYLLFLLAIAVPLLCAYPLTTNEGELGKAGMNALSRNLLEAWGMARASVQRLGNVGLLLVITGGWAWWRHRHETNTDSPIRLWVLPLFIGLTLAPHLFNRSYFATYYLYAPLIWTSLLVVVVGSRFFLKHPALALAQGALVAVLLLPGEEVKQFQEQFRRDSMPRVMSAIQAATAPVPKPCGVVLRTPCSEPEQARQSMAALREVLFRSDGNAIKWATGWGDLETIFEGESIPQAMQQCSQPLFIDYCESQPVRVATQ
jgi:hypothetical protein